VTLFSKRTTLRTFSIYYKGSLEDISILWQNNV
jgi:hypothetical protein